jgi:hypothetical protein
MVAAALFIGPFDAAGQEVRGTVQALEDGAPLAGALLTLLDPEGQIRATTISDSTGGFVLRAPVGDSVTLQVQHFGFAAIESVPVALADGELLRLEIRMRPSPVALEGVTVTGKVRLPRPLERFLRRKAMGFGRTLGPEELSRLPRTSTAMLLASVPAGFLFPGAAGTILGRSQGGDVCQPDVYVDGLEVESAGGGTAEQGFGVPVGSYVHPELIMGIEVYRYPGQAPFEFQYAFMPDCPVVLIWTNHSFGIGR